MADKYAMYIDASKCMACRGCQVACKQWNDNPGYVPGVRETRLYATRDSVAETGPYESLR